MSLSNFGIINNAPLRNVGEGYYYVKIVFNQVYPFNSSYSRLDSLCGTRIIEGL